MIEKSKEDEEYRKNRWRRNSIVYCPVLVQKGTILQKFISRHVITKPPGSAKNAKSLLDVLIVKSHL